MENWKSYWADEWKGELERVKSRSGGIALDRKKKLQDIRFSKLIAEGFLPEEALKLRMVRFTNRAMNTIRMVRRNILAGFYNKLLEKGKKRGRDTYLLARKMVYDYIVKKNLVIRDIGNEIERMYRQGKIKKYSHISSDAVYTELHANKVYGRRGVYSRV